MLSPLLNVVHLAVNAHVFFKNLQLTLLTLPLKTLLISLGVRNLQVMKLLFHHQRFFLSLFFFSYCLFKFFVLFIDGSTSLFQILLVTFYIIKNWSKMLISLLFYFLLLFLLIFVEFFKLLLSLIYIVYKCVENILIKLVTTLLYLRKFDIHISNPCCMWFLLKILIIEINAFLHFHLVLEKMIIDSLSLHFDIHCHMFLGQTASRWPNRRCNLHLILLVIIKSSFTF